MFTPSVHLSSDLYLCILSSDLYLCILGNAVARQLQEQQLQARQLVLQQQAASAVAAASKTQREVKTSFMLHAYMPRALPPCKLANPASLPCMHLLFACLPAPHHLHRMH